MKNVKMHNKTWWRILDIIQRVFIFDAKVDFRDFWGPKMFRGVWAQVRWCFLKYLWTDKFRFRMDFDRFLPKFENFQEFLSIFCRFLMFWQFLKSSFRYVKFVRVNKLPKSYKIRWIFRNFKKSEFFKNLKNHKILI